MPSAGPGLIGRDDALGTVAAAFDRAAAGLPQLLLINGETGIGKSRLIAEFLDRSAGLSLAGHCLLMAGEPLPFAPIVQAVRSAVRTGVAAREVQRLPELARLLPDAPAEAGAATAADQLRMFQAVLTLLARLGITTPVTLVIEDVHWADRSTLDLIRFLAANLVDERVLVLLSQRDDAARSPDFASWTAELRRLPTVSTLALARIDDDAAADLVRATLGYPPEPPVLADLVARSAGNPLFVEELARAAESGNSRLPDDLRALLGARLAALPDSAMAALQALAVVGRRAQVGLLAALVGEDAAAVEERLLPARAETLVVVDRDGLIDFRHPAFGEVAYSELMPEQRRRLHAAAAAALTSNEAFATDAAGELARHWHQAGDLPRALEAALAAGHAAERRYAFADAYANFVRAELLMATVPHPADRTEVLISAAMAASLLGDTTEAIRLLDRARDGLTDSTRLAGLLAQTGAVHFAAGRGDRAEEALRQAAEMLPEGEVSTLSARVHAWLAKLAAAWGRLDEAETEAGLALEIASAVGATREQGRAMAALGIVTGTRGEFTESVAWLRSALEIARAEYAAEELVSGYINLSHVLGSMGELDQQVALCQEGVAVLTEHGLVRQGGALLMANTVESLTRAGRLEDAGLLIDQTMALHPRGIMSAPILIRAAMVSVLLGNGDLAIEQCERARLVIATEDAPVAWHLAVLEMGVLVDLWTRRWDSAYQRALAGLASTGSARGPEPTRLTALALAAAAELADRDRTDQAAIAHRRSEVLLASGWDGLSGVNLSTTWLAKGELARLDRSPDEAAIWRRYRKSQAPIQMDLECAYAGMREVEALLRQGVGAEAIALLRQTHAQASRIGVRVIVAEVENLARWYRIDLLPEQESVDASDDPMAAYGLTEREREVLHALAAGLSNSEIAKSLFISVKTASVHVSNILRKLGASGRQEAARVAHRHGITGLENPK